MDFAGFTAHQIFFFNSVRARVYMCLHVCVCPQRPEDSIRFSGAGATGSYGLSYLDAGN